VKFERQAATSGGIKPEGRDRYAALCIICGPRGHPKIRIYRELLVTWFFLLQECQANHQYLLQARLTWRKISDNLKNILRNKETLQPGHCKWTTLFKHVEGIMSHVIYLLLCLDWDPRHLELWINPKRETWVLTSFKALARTDLIQEVTESIHSQEQKRAANHYLSPPPQSKIAWHHTPAQKFKFKNKESSNECAILETCIAAGMWPAQRIHDIHHTYPSPCPSCKKSAETTKHALYECPANHEIDHPFLWKTQHVATRALTNFDSSPHYWGRFIITEDLLKIPTFHEPMAEYPLQMTTDTLLSPSQGQWPEGDYFGDGSGGKNGSTPEIRRCGFGAVHMSEEFTDFLSDNLDSMRWPAYFGFWSKLPGPTQTVPRAELSALLTVIQNVQPNSTINYYIDNKMVHDTFHKGMRRALLAANADLFLTLFTTPNTKNITLSLKWMPSHLDTNFHKKRPQWVRDYHIAGNKAADLQADLASAAHQLPFQVIEPVLRNIKHLRIIQRRAVIIYQHMPDRPPPIKPPKHTTKLITEDHLRATKHHLTETNTKYRCQACHSWISKNAKLLFVTSQTPHAFPQRQTD